VCGGAILDFLGGKVSRAPEWLRRLGGEWLYRLLREPKRLFIALCVGNPLFLVRTLLFRCDGGRPGTPYERQNPPER
jgi:Teichoic acid biosynthesis proteins